MAGLLDTDVAPRGDRVQSATGFYCEDSRELVTSEGEAHSAQFKSFVITVDDPIDWTCSACG